MTDNYFAVSRVSHEALQRYGGLANKSHSRKTRLYLLTLFHSCNILEMSSLEKTPGVNFGTLAELNGELGIIPFFFVNQKLIF